MAVRIFLWKYNSEIYQECVWVLVAEGHHRMLANGLDLIAHVVEVLCDLCAPFSTFCELSSHLKHTVTASSRIAVLENRRHIRPSSFSILTLGSFLPPQSTDIAMIPYIPSAIWPLTLYSPDLAASKDLPVSQKLI